MNEQDPINSAFYRRASVVDAGVDQPAHLWLCIAQIAGRQRLKIGWFDVP
jgi:hypothetical protein